MFLIITIYTPSGNAKRQEREAFFNNDLPSILGTENTTYAILINNTEKPVEHTAPNMDVPRHKDNTHIDDTNPPPTVEPESHRIHSDAHSVTEHQQQQQDQMEHDTVTVNEDTVHNATTTRQNRENRNQTKIHTYEQIEQQKESMSKCSDSGDMLIEEMDTHLTQQDKEGDQDGERISPKRPKKMEVVKMGEPQNECPRSSTRRTALKDRET